MNLESKKTTVEKSAAYLFEALNDLSNFEKIMPDNTSKFEVVDENCFIFGLKGTPEIKLLKKVQLQTLKLFLEPPVVNFRFL